MSTSDPGGDDLPAMPDAEMRRLPPTRVVVVGGGAAGLVAAYDLARPGFEVTLVEASGHTGGGMLAHEVAGLVLDVGAESFATRGGAVEELLGDLRLTGQIVKPHSSGAWLHAGGRSVPLPAGGMLGIPASPLARDVIAAIGWPGALRAYLDRLIPVMKIGREEHLDRLVARRMGKAVLERLVAPIVTGVYSTPVEDADIEAILPGLNGALTRAGSLSGAVAELRTGAARAAGRAKPGAAVLGLRGGMHVLADRLAEEVRSRGGRLLVGAPVDAVRPGGGDAAATGAASDTARDDAGGEEARNPAWRVHLADGDVLDADAVVVATSGPEARRILRDASAGTGRLAGLDWPQATRVDIVTLVLDQPGMDAAPRGTGLLVAQARPDRGLQERPRPVQAKALTHSSAKWPWLARALAPHRHVVRLSYGRPGGAVSQAGDAQLRARAVADTAALFDLPVTDSMVVAWDRAAWELPATLVRGRRARLDAVRAALDGLDGLEVTGAWISGTGLASVVPAARQAARRIRGLRWKTLTESLPGTAGDS